jgi:D-alanyl-lipoteichoic acid acyltransferase DltB (MBOAT superfamily)
MCLGFRLPDNFRFPYAAIGFSDFWRRWHISLSSWLRDYLYISLGGNRGGRLFTSRNLALTMLLGGLWHGASWRFVAWGGLHGLYLIGERVLRHALGDRVRLERWPSRVLAVLFTHALVLITWVFFRATDFRSAFSLLRTMFAGSDSPALLPRIDVGIVVVLSAGLLAWHGFMRERTYEDLFAPLPWWVRALVPAALLFLLTLAPGGDRVFIYFQF